VTERTCPGCSGPISRGAQLCRLCRPRAIAAGVNLLAPGARSSQPQPPAGARTTGQNRAYHGKCGTLARLRDVPVREIKDWALAQASTRFRRNITSSADMNEDEMSDVLDTLDDAIAEASDE
jgi:hypothetical protein